MPLPWAVRKRGTRLVDAGGYFTGGLSSRAVRSSELPGFLTLKERQAGQATGESLRSLDKYNGERQLQLLGIYNRFCRTDHREPIPFRVRKSPP